MLIKALEKEAECNIDDDKKEEPKVKPTTIARSPGGSYKIKGKANVCDRAKPSSCDCCCQAHHELSFHGVTGNRVDVFASHTIQNEFPFFDGCFVYAAGYDRDHDLQEVCDRIRHSANDGESSDQFFDILTALETDFGLDCVEDN